MFFVVLITALKDGVKLIFISFFNSRVKSNIISIFYYTML